MSLWLPEAKALNDDAEDSGGEGSKTVKDPIDCLPIPFDAQLKAAKTLIEVEEYDVCSQ